MSSPAAESPGIDLRSETMADAARAWPCLAPLSDFYPDFDRWYWQTVVPGLADGTRALRLVERDGEIVGALIAKRDDDERKICCLWVRDDRKGRGYGVRLIKEAIEWLGTPKPLVSVPEERLAEFAPTFAGFGFVLTEAVDSAYRPGRKEFVFNGRASLSRLESSA
jgi:GNAT superfamily N-acetyltransferase